MGDLAANVEQFLQIVELPVDVATDGDWGLDWLDVGFEGEDLSAFGAEGLDLGLRELFALVQLGDPGVQVEIHWGSPCRRSWKL